MVLAGRKSGIVRGLPAGDGTARDGGITKDIFDKRGTPRNSQYNGTRRRVYRRVCILVSTPAGGKTPIEPIRLQIRARADQGTLLTTSGGRCSGQNMKRVS